MSIAISKLVWENGPENPADTLMMLALAEHADHTGYCWPGVEALARKCRVSRRTAQRTLRKLEADGWMRVVVRGRGRLSNRYQINVPNLEYGAYRDASRRDTHVASDATPTSPEPSRNHQKNHQTLSSSSEHDPWAAEGEGVDLFPNPWRTP